MPAAPAAVHRLVLCIDEDADHRERAVQTLRPAGLQVVAGGPGRVDLTVARVQPDLVLVDPGDAASLESSVSAVCAATTAPVIVVSAHARDLDVARSLGAGARDHIAKPWSPVELTARVLRALQPPGRTPDQPGCVVVGDLEIRSAERRALVGGRDVRLTTLEFDLLARLASQPGTVFSRSDLLAQVWGHRFGDSSTVAVYVRRLRAKIEADPANPTRLKTRWGVGYWLDDTAPAADEAAQEDHGHGYEALLWVAGSIWTRWRDGSPPRPPCPLLVHEEMPAARLVSVVDGQRGYPATALLRLSVDVGTPLKAVATWERLLAGSGWARVARPERPSNARRT